MRLYLINPVNPLALVEIRTRWFNKYRVWKPLGLLTLAALTPSSWDVTIFDENTHQEDYDALPRPDLVGITAFTSQATRAYDLARQFHAMGVPVVMGGIHASMRPEEAGQYVDSVVVGEAESTWHTVLEDLAAGTLKPIYRPTCLTDNIPAARHDLLPTGYAFGVIQTTRGCPLNCSFCSVTAFNGARYRHRPIADVVAELKTIHEKMLLIVDDNLIGTSATHVARAKELFRAIIAAGIRKKWIAQVTINIGDDPELLDLARQAGCIAVFIGFESPTAGGLAEVGKKFNLSRNRDPKATVRQIRRHGILVVGSFIMGLDEDHPGIGRKIARAAIDYGVDFINTLFLTPLPGTRLWDKMAAEGRIATSNFPEDWKYYTLTYPVARYQNLSREQIITEMETCDRKFFSKRRILGRVIASLWHGRHPLFTFVGSLSYRGGIPSNSKAYRRFARDRQLADPTLAESVAAMAQAARAGWNQLRGARNTEGG